MTTGTLPEERSGASPHPTPSEKPRSIAWVTDYERAGGAERTEGAAIARSPFRDKIEVVTPERFDTHFSFYILNSCRNLTELQLEWVIRNRPFMVFSHDVLPTTHISLRYEMFGRSRLNVFLSPLHLRETRVRYGIEIPRSVVVPPVWSEPLRVSETASGAEGACWVGSIYKHKGIDAVLLWAREHETVVDFYGAGEPILTAQIEFSRYANYHGRLENTAEIYRTHKTLVHLPEEVEACGRSVIEAYLAGCEMIVNRRVGFYSYDLDFRDRESVAEFLNRAPALFWEATGDLVESV